jgi:hypothetical protein
MMPSSTGRRVVLDTCTLLLCLAAGHDVVRREDATKEKEKRKGKINQHGHCRN